MACAQTTFGRAFRSLVVGLCATMAWSGATAAPLANPLRFFEGRTESVGTMKAIMKRTFRVRSIGQGRIAADGSLTLVQQVRDEGQPPSERVWHIRQVSPTSFTGTMSEAKGPVTIERVGDRYLFRFKVRGGLNVEQWLVPNADGTSGASILTVRKLGMVVAKSEGIIRKLSLEANSAH